MIAERLNIRNRTLGNTNEYFNGCVRQCTFTAGAEEIPDESMLIRSEDIMHHISMIRKRNADTDKLVQGWLRKGIDKKRRGTLEADMEVQRRFETIYDRGGGGDEFHGVMVSKLMEKTDEESNGETAINYFRDRLFADNLLLLSAKLAYGT